MKRISRSPWPFLVLGAGVVCFGAAAAAAGFGLVRRAPVEVTDRLVLNIRLPTIGTRVAVGDSVAVLIQASGAGPITRYELWVDGEQQALRVLATGEAELPPTAQMVWRPSEPGPHVLLAFAFGTDGLSARSRPVVIEAVEPPSDERISLDVTVQPGDTAQSVGAEFGLTPDDLLAANPGWSGEADTGDEIRVPIPAGDLPEDFRGDDLGAPPEPAGEDFLVPPLPERFPRRPGIPRGAPSKGCGMALKWDATAGADGYRVYRLGIGDADFAVIAQTRAGETALADTVRFAGVYQYMVEAFNGAGSVEGPPARLLMPDELCPPYLPVPDQGTAWLDLELLDFVAGTDFDRAYCYASPFPGAVFFRIPSDENEFLTPAGGVWDIGDFAAGMQRMEMAQPADQPVRLRMECLGWRGDDLVDLGSLDLEHPRPEWDGRRLVGAASAFEAVYRISAHDGETPAMRPVLFEIGPPPPERFRRPQTSAECLEHVAVYSIRDAGAAFAGALACLTADWDQPVNDLGIWDWTERADPRYSRHELHGFRIYLDRLGRDPDEVDASEWELFAETDVSPQLFPLLRPPCGEAFTYWATSVGAAVPAFDELGAGEEGPGAEPPIPGQEFPLSPVLESVPSNAVPVSGPDCPIQQVLVEVSLDSIDVGHTWDGCLDIDFECEDVRLETYGTGTFFRVTPEGEAEAAAEVTFWGDFAGRCGPARACQGLGSVRANRTVELAAEPMRVCVGDDCTGLDEGNNTVAILVGDGDDIVFEFSLWDQDDDSGDDIWCGTTDDASGWGGAGKFPAESSLLNTGARTANEWAALDGAVGRWSNDGLDRQDAQCTLHFITSALEVTQ